jgi:hypothetical protein
MIPRHGYLAALVALSLGGCGGRVAGYDTAGTGPDGGRIEPVPTCGAICAHIIGGCAPGAATDACVKDCEAAKARFGASCQGLLDAYLRCIVTTRVECKPMDIVILDCSDERNRLDECHS